MGSLAIAKTVLPGRKGPAIGEGARLPADEVVHVHEGSNLAADHISIGRGGQPLIERSALVRLEMAVADVAQIGNVDEL